MILFQIPGIQHEQERSMEFISSDCGEKGEVEGEGARQETENT